MNNVIAPPKNTPIWVDRPQTFQRMLEDLSHYPILSVDTESNSLFAYREQVCLIQFSTGRTDYLVDPKTLHNLDGLAVLFADPGIEKVFHASEYDLICLKRDFNFKFTNIFDTMQAARILGRRAVGLGSMLEAEFGIVLDKRYQRANWGLRPLTNAMISYARLDTFYLISLRARLKADLEATGRWPLAVEDFQRLCTVDLPVLDNGVDLCWRVAGGHELDHQQLAVIQELCRYRDLMAQRSDVPPFKILGGDTLVLLAQNCPVNLEELRNISGMTARKVERYGEGLLKAVQVGLQTAPVYRQPNHRPDNDYLQRIDLLRAWRKKAGQTIGVESDVILPRDVMEAIAESAPSGLPELAPLMKDLPYRFSVYGEQILSVLKH
jgi:ribonuclease D